MTSSEKRFKQLIKKTPALDLRNMYAFMMRRGATDQKTHIVEKELNKRK